jgi:uncharacterized protein GlcG (DUF336 family)
MITLDLARAIIAGTLAQARAAGLQPLAVIVLDAGGHPLAFEREDGASFGRFDIARAKAHGALAMGEDTAALAQRAAGNPLFFASLSGALDGKLALSPGGVLVRNHAGQVIGAVGVSGDAGPADAAAAIAGITAAGLEARA